MSDEDERLAQDSAAVALWTTVSRLTGFARSAVVAAVLGPTYFGNTFQATNVLPNLTYELLTASLFASLLMPHLVGHLDMEDQAGARRVAGGFLGVSMVGFTILAAGALLAGPLLLRLFSLGVVSPTVAADQRRVGLILLATLMPQVVLYGIAGTSAAVLNARGRFGLAAAAPAMENLGMILTLAVTAVIFGTAPSLETVTLSQILLLGIGTTAAVGIHAGILWWGTWRVGVGLVPRAGWRDKEVRALIQRIVPSIGYAALNVLRLFAVLIVANGVAGGVVAFQLALSFFYLPVAVGARPVAVTLLPRLARLHRDGPPELFRDEFVRGLAMGLFLTIPAAVAYLALATPLARAVAFGEMATSVGQRLVAVSLMALAVGIVGEGMFVMATHACYASNDAAAPFRSSLVRTGVVITGIAIAFSQSDHDVLIGLGLALSASNLLAAIHLGRRLRRRLPSGGQRLWPSVLRALAASLVMAVPAVLLAVGVPHLIPGRAGRLGGTVLAVLVGVIVYLGTQHASQSPELRWLLAAWGRRGPGREASV